MGIAEAVMAGQKLRQYIDESPQRIEENRLKAQLYKAQAEHQSAQAGLIQQKVQSEQQRLQELNQLGTLGQQPPTGQATIPYGYGTSEEALPQQPRASTTQIAQQQDPSPYPGLAPQLYTPEERAFATKALITSKYDPEAGAKMYNALSIQQQHRLKVEEQQVYAALAGLENQRRAAMQGGTLTREQDAMLRSKQVELLLKAGRPNDALKLASGDTTVLNPGAELYQSFSGGPQQKVAANTGEGGLSKDQARLNVDLYGSPTPPPGFPQATREAITYKNTQAQNNANLGLPSGTPATGAASAPKASQGTPRVNTPVNPAAVEQAQPGTTLFDATIDGQTYTVEAPSQAEAEQVFRSRLPGRTFTVTPRTAPAATVGPRAQLAGQTEAERLRQQGLEPGNPQRPVTGQRQQAEQNVQAGQQGATAEDVTRARTSGENLDTTTQQKILPLRHATRVIQSIKAVPKEKQEAYVGLLRKPTAELESFLADLGTASAGDKDLYRFLADVSDLRYTLTRPDVGANFTENENKLLGDVYPTARERTATAFFEKLDRLVPLLERKMDDTIDLATTTRGQLRRGQGQEKPTEPQQAPTTKAPEETPEQQADRLRQKYGIQKRVP